MHVCVYIYIYIYTHTYTHTYMYHVRVCYKCTRIVPTCTHWGVQTCTARGNTTHIMYKIARASRGTPNLPTNIVDFRRFDSSTILMLRGEIFRPIGDFPESLSQPMLAGTMLVGRLGVR